MFINILIDIKYLCKLYEESPIKSDYEDDFDDNYIDEKPEINSKNQGSKSLRWI